MEEKEYGIREKVNPRCGERGDQTKEEMQEEEDGKKKEENKKKD